MATSHDKLHELLEDFGVAMLVTRAADGNLRGRPMALAEAEPDGTLWFASARDSGKVDELEVDSHVVVTMQSSTKFVSLSGQARLVDDREKVARLWKTEWKVWFPGGKDDPNILLLRVDGSTGEYWDNSGTNGVTATCRNNLSSAARTIAYGTIISTRLAGVAVDESVRTSSTGMDSTRHRRRSRCDRKCR